MSERIGVARLLLGPLLVGATLLGTAPAPAAAPRWNVDWGEQRCSLIRLSEHSRSPIFALRTVPGSGHWEARLFTRSWPRGARGDVNQLRISLQPDGAALPDRRRIERTPSGEALVIYPLPSPLDTLAASRAIRVERNGETVLEIPLTETAQAVAAIRQCVTAVLREWGIDPASYAAIRAWPRGDIAAVVEDADYPLSAVRDRLSGTVVVRMTIDIAGRVSECTPVVSSGHEILDTRACEIFRQRLRLTPAIGLNGAPTPAVLVTTLTWHLPVDRRVGPSINQ